MGNRQSSIGDISMGRFLDGGSYGDVYQGTWRGKRVALKKLKLTLFEGYEYNRGTVFDNLRKEWDILSQMNHPNIVEYYTVITSERAPPIIVFELCKCNLFSFIREESDRKVKFQDIVSIMSDVAQGLDYMHGLIPPIVHRDLTSKNILLTVNNRAKITDMGISKAFPHGAMYATVGVGTPYYRAPETHPLKLPTGGFEQMAYYTEKVDIFSFGVVLLEMIVGHLPSGFLQDPLLEDGEVVPEYIRRSSDIYEMGPDHPLHSLVITCLCDLPEDRPSTAQLIEALATFRSAEAKANDDIDKKSISSSKVSLDTSTSVIKVSKDRYDYNFKIVVLGDVGVGKSSIIHRFIHPYRQLTNSSCTYQPADFFERLQYMGKSVHLHLVDTPGNTRLHVSDLISFVYRGVNGAVIVFNVGDQLSFSYLSDWIDAVHDRCGPETPIVLVGNKTDLPPEQWKISSRDVEAFATEKHLFYIETSALSLNNIEEIFCILINRMIRCRESMLKSPDWALYEACPKSSLLKGDVPHITTPISDRTPAPPIPSSNIQLGKTSPKLYSFCSRC